jgi:alpha-tubulin suppressor-like RCC1 family protein
MLAHANALLTERIAGVVNRYSHSIAVVDEHDVYTWGSAAWAQLGASARFGFFHRTHETHHVASATTQGTVTSGNASIRLW